MIHMSIDNDETLEKTCESCQSKAQEDKCISCGSSMFVEANPNFDESLFEKLSKDYKE